MHPAPHRGCSFTRCSLDSFARSASTSAGCFWVVCGNRLVDVAFPVSEPFQPPAGHQVILFFQHPNSALSLAEQFRHLEGLALLDRERFRIAGHLELAATMMFEIRV